MKLTVTKFFAEMKLSAGQTTLIDVEDLERIKGYGWYATANVMGGYYAKAATRHEDGRRTNVYLHRLVANAPQGMQVDHINHDTLDNRKTNLRVVTKAENEQNRKGAEVRNKLGIRNVSVTRNNYGRPYYYVAVQATPRHGKTVRRCKTFPYTPDGLTRATRHAEETRRELTPDLYPEAA